MFGPRVPQTSNIVYNKCAPLVVFGPSGCEILATGLLLATDRFRTAKLQNAYLE